MLTEVRAKQLSSLTHDTYKLSNMKTRVFLTSLAVAAGLFGLSSCDNKIESLSMEKFEKATKVAEILLDCESAADIKASLDEIKEISKEGKDIAKELERSESEFEKITEEEMTQLELERMKNRLAIAGTKADGLMEDARSHAKELCKDDFDMLEKLAKALDAE